MLIGLVRLGSVIGAPMGGALSDKIGRKPGVLISIIGVGPLILLLTLLPYGLGLMAVFVLLGGFINLRQPALQALIVESIPRGQRSTFLGFYFFLSLEGRSLIVPAIGYLMDSFGLVQTFNGLALAALALSATALLFRKRV
jgi:MFS family permease